MKCPYCKVSGWIDSSQVWGNLHRCRVCKRWFRILDEPSEKDES